MNQDLYVLVGAVQDLYDLYLRIGPQGPYRLSLFSDPAEISADWPAPVQASAARIDQLARGVSCLLANDLAAAAPAVIAELWREVRRLEAQLNAPGWHEPGYYGFLTDELRGGRQLESPQAYRYFGEVLSIYLEIICGLRDGAQADYLVRIQRLRETVLQTGEISSRSTGLGASGAVGKD
ncbi:hypothetical protein JW859_06735 [bacterium]|nr:hypothetical protein [bacterium]